MNPEDIHVRFLRKEEIWGSVEKFRADYAVDDLPVNVLDLAEFDLGLDLVPAYALTEECDTDAVLLGDLKTILVDKRSFTNPSSQYRLRFSVAHEIGHLILHAALYQGIKHNDANAWLEFMSSLPEKEHGWIEWQANEFAGRLLVPLSALNESFSLAVKKASAAGVQPSTIRDQSTLDLLSRFIQKRFDVSAGVIARRLQAEDLWPPDI